MTQGKLTIESIETDLFVVPIKDVLHVGRHLPPRTRHVTLLCRFKTAEGLDGHSYVHADSIRQIMAIRALIPDVEDAVKGCDPLQRQDLLHRTALKLRELLQFEGAVRMVMSLVDIAAWDLLGKYSNLPVHRVIGGSGDDVLVYGSHGLAGGQPTEELAPTARAIIGEGHGGVKVRVGGGRSLKDDVDRVMRVREAIGEGPRIMLDALWSLTPRSAIALARAVYEADITWLEDPVPENNFSALRFIRERVDIPIASAERMSAVRDFVRILDAEAIDIAIIDLHHIGGVTPWLVCAELARQRDIVINGHGAFQLNCHLLSAVTNGFQAEYFPFSAELYTNAPVPANGVITPPERPGWGLELNEDVIAEYRYEEP
jgi:L-alanine-DL-glutamate epimerase-like enolase superfamily enzyme